MIRRLQFDLFTIFVLTAAVAAALGIRSLVQFMGDSEVPDDRWIKIVAVPQLVALFGMEILIIKWRHERRGTVGQLRRAGAVIAAFVSLLFTFWMGIFGWAVGHIAMAAGVGWLIGHYLGKLAELGQARE